MQIYKTILEDGRKCSGAEIENLPILKALIFVLHVDFTGCNSLKTADYGGRFAIVPEKSQNTLQVMVNEATTIAQNCGGGGSSATDDWGKKPDDDKEWARE